MEQILDKYCNFNNGLFLLNLPTGFGKTYEVLQYLLRHHDDNRTVYFITHLKKNLPFEELRELFKAHGLEEEFNQKALFIDSTSAKVIENVAKLEVSDEVKKWEEFKALKQKARLVTNYENSKKPNGQQAEANKIIKDEIRIELEPKFRGKLIAYIDRKASIQGKYASPKAKLNWIEQNASWIAKLYPSVYCLRKKIFFLSVDKFFTRNVTLIQPSYYFHEHKSIENALVFLDEFDASKAPLLSSIIDNGLRKRIDMVALFQQLYSTFTTLQFPANLQQESEARQRTLSTDSKKRPIREIIEHLHSEALKLADQFHLDVPFKTVNPDNRRNFIFHDFQYLSIIKDGARFIRLEYDEVNQVNNIHFDREKGGKGQSLLNMLARLRAYLQFFSKGVWITAMNYCELKTEADSHEFPLESALRTVLDLFNLNSLQVNYVLDIIANHETKAEVDGLPNSNYLREHSFYMNGFRYYDFVDGDTHDLTSRIYICAFEVTPEKLLLKLAQKANVIGISATATIPTSIGNYDLEFLNQRLRNNYRTVNDEEHIILQDHFEKLTKGYRQLIINAELVQCEADLTTATKIFEDEKFSVSLLKQLGESYPSRHFFIRRYLRAARVFKYFLLTDDIHSFLYLGNAHPKGFQNQDFGEDILEKMFRFLIVKFDKGQYFNSREKSFTVIDSDQFDDKKASFINRLSKGQKLFIISTYQTLGAGQNLQYPTPKSLKVIQINERNQEKRLKDIDGIYCERPTNLLVNKFAKGIGEKELIKNIFEIEFLSEAGEISEEQVRHEIRAGFQLISGRERQRNNKDLKENNLYSKKSFAQYISKVVIQAIGRMSRTNLKSPSIHVLAHNRLNGLLRKAPGAKQIYLHEYNQLLSVCTESVSPENEEQYYNIAGRNNSRGLRIIQSMLNKEFEENNREYWQQLRDFVLKNPRLDQLSEIPSHFQPFYFKLPPGVPTYQYNEKDQRYKNSSNRNSGVSEFESRLYLLMQNPEIKAYFQQKGYATTFGEGSFILTPTAYNQIYKGILGETTGKFILGKHAYIRLQPLGLEEFEKFDFKTSNGIYVDFKHWRNGGYANTDEQYRNIENKINKTKAEKIMIINLIGSSAYHPRKKGNLLEIPFLIDEETFEVNAAMIREIQDFIF